MKCLSMRDREAMLLRWYRRRQRELSSKFVPMSEFDEEYRKLFGRRPLWYYWNHFYRDHGSVGLKSIAS